MCASKRLASAAFLLFAGLLNGCLNCDLGVTDQEEVVAEEEHEEEEAHETEKPTLEAEVQQLRRDLLDLKDELARTKRNNDSISPSGVRGEMPASAATAGASGALAGAAEVPVVEPVRPAPAADLAPVRPFQIGPYACARPEGGGKILCSQMAKTSQKYRFNSPDYLQQMPQSFQCSSRDLCIFPFLAPNNTDPLPALRKLIAEEASRPSPQG